MGRFVRLAAIGHRRQIGAVGLDQDAIERTGGKDGAQFMRFGECDDPRHRKIEAQIQRRAGQVCARGEAVHHAGKRAVAMFLRQDRGHVCIGGTGMDDQGQAGLARGLDMQAQAALLDRRAVGGIVIVKAGFADADEFGVLRQGDQFGHPGQRLIGSVHRMGSRRPVDPRMRLGDGPDLGRGFQPRADGDHPRNAGSSGAADDIAGLRCQIGKVEMAMAVNKGGNGITGSSGGNFRGPARCRVDLDKAIEDHVGRVKVHGPRMGETAASACSRSAQTLACAGPGESRAAIAASPLLASAGAGLPAPARARRAMASRISRTTMS